MNARRQLRFDALPENLDEVLTVLRRQDRRGKNVASADLRLQHVGGNAEIDRRFEHRGLRRRDTGAYGSSKRIGGAGHGVYAVTSMRCSPSAARPNGPL